MEDRPKREELILLAKQDPEAIADLMLNICDRFEKLEEEIAELKKNSRNSSKPPSSDRNNKPPKSQRERGKRRPGGQEGHQGHHLKASENPDEIIVHAIEGKCDCGCDLKKAEVKGYEARQVFDLPKEITLEVTEHRVEKGVCPECGKECKASFPEEVKAPVQYGERIQGVVVYLSGYQLIPCERLSDLCSTLFNCPLSPGTVVNIVNRAGSQAEPIAEEIKERISQAESLHSDETGINLSGKNQWLHVACTPELAYFQIDPKRGFEAMERIGILPNYGGFVIHDFYSSYYKFENCSHGLCNAHHLRDLTYIEEDLGQPWAGEMKSFLVEAKCLKDKERIGEGSIGPDELASLEARYDAILSRGYELNPEPEKIPGKRGRQKRGKALNLLDRFRDRKKEVLGFLYYDLPFDNNEAERDLRMMKTKQKISGCFRSSDQAKAFTNIRSIITSAKKKSLDILNVLALTLRNPAQAADLILST